MLLKLQVKVKPNAKQQKIEEMADNHFKIAVKSPPTDGKANQELITLLAKHFNVPKSHILIKSGVSSRNKLVEIDT
ncbi:DUF167 domain-containing protein [Crocosphaera chwakensis]|uniref:UPF0235 protein CY0110_24581 n=1 Tax=Crocosphaera chwakensis CCY0110 TaxID=391612 RepID=A3IMP2_9CHRO|nr:DUF167 domain-containing protein [Crocosphaera chwakensis]EAZ92145.1 hypothetical protein CY0110_24581 [Crocosphaera chwakensis CCY0110]